MTGLQPRSSVLDVGCGTGSGLGAALAATDGTAVAVGVDVSDGMLRQVSDISGRPAALVLADAVELPFRADAFDVVVSCFALTYFASPIRAAAEMRRVLAPQGVLGLCICDGWWYQGDVSWGWHEELLDEIGYVAPVALFQNPAVAVGLLRRADFCPQEVTVEVFALQWTDAAEWWRWCWSHGYRAVLEELPPIALNEYQRRCFERLGDSPVEGRLEVVLASAALAPP